MLKCLSVHLKLQRKSPPTFKSLGPFQSCLSLLTVFQLPGTFWPSSASSFVFSCSPKDSSVLFSAHSTSTQELPGEGATGGAACAGTSCHQLSLVLTQDPLDPFRTRFRPFITRFNPTQQTQLSPSVSF